MTHCTEQGPRPRNQMQFRQSLRRALEKPSLESQLTPLRAPAASLPQLLAQAISLGREDPAARVGAHRLLSTCPQRQQCFQRRLRMVSVWGESGSWWRAAH